MAIRNQRLAALNVSGAGSHTLYTVPTGDVVLLKSIAVRNNNGSALAFNVGLHAPASGPNCDVLGVYSPSTLPGFQSQSLVGWWALNAADYVYINLPSGGSWDVWLSGALLSN